jgi:hypothetical protein
MRRKPTLIVFRDVPAMREALKTAAGPYGDMSKVARAAIRKGLRELGHWPTKQDKPKQDAA